MTKTYIFLIICTLFVMEIGMCQYQPPKGGHIKGKKYVLSELATRDSTFMYQLDSLLINTSKVGVDLDITDSLYFFIGVQVTDDNLYVLWVEQIELIARLHPVLGFFKYKNWIYFITDEWPDSLLYKTDVMQTFKFESFSWDGIIPPYHHPSWRISYDNGSLTLID